MHVSLDPPRATSRGIGSRAPKFWYYEYLYGVRICFTKLSNLPGWGRVGGIRAWGYEYKSKGCQTPVEGWAVGRNGHFPHFRSVSRDWVGWVTCELLALRTSEYQPLSALSCRERRRRKPHSSFLSFKHSALLSSSGWRATVCMFVSGESMSPIAAYLSYPGVFTFTFIQVDLVEGIPLPSRTGPRSVFEWAYHSARKPADLRVQLPSGYS